MNKKKVLFIFSSFSFGGAEQMTVNTAFALNKFSSEFESVVGVPAGSSLSVYSQSKRIKTVDFKCRGTLTPSGIFSLIRIILKEKISIIHVRQGKLFWTALFMKIFFPSVKIVLHRTQDTRHKWYARYHYRFADKVLTVSEAIRRNIINVDRAPEKNVKTLYNGFDFDFFVKNADASDIIKKYGLENKTVVGTAGAMVSFEGKGQIYLMEAVSKIKKDYPDLRCLLVGDGAGRAQLEQYAEKLAISDIVIFAGYQKEIARYINAMNIFCLMSCDTEGFGNVNVEAQALSKPVITTNIGGIPETVVDKKTAIIVKPRDSQAVADALIKLLDDKTLALNMGIEGKKFVENSFSDTKMVSNLTAVYRDLSAQD